MTVAEMHYDFKRKFNKLDSLSQRDFLVPEIDWMLNEAQLVFVKQRYGRSNSKRVGFEVLQKRIDDLRVLVIKNRVMPLAATGAIDANEFAVEINSTTAPDYLFALRVRVRTQLDGCDAVLLKGYQVEHDDLTDVLHDEFYAPSYLWREVPVVFGGAVDGTSSIFTYGDGTFTPSDIVLDYLRYPKRIGNPDGFRDGDGYNTADGTPAVQQDCELPDHTHTEIVDIAVKIAAGDVMSPQYAVAKDKLTDNE